MYAFLSQAELQQATEDEDLTADEVLLRRMDAGLYTLQQCALIIGNLWIVGDQLVKQRILMLLHQQVLDPFKCHGCLILPVRSGHPRCPCTCHRLAECRLDIERNGESCLLRGARLDSPTVQVPT